MPRTTSPWAADINRAGVYRVEPRIEGPLWLLPIAPMETPVVIAKTARLRRWRASCPSLTRVVRLKHEKRRRARR